MKYRVWFAATPVGDFGRYFPHMLLPTGELVRLDKHFPSRLACIGFINDHLGSAGVDED